MRKLDKRMAVSFRQARELEARVAKLEKQVELLARVCKENVEARVHPFIAWERLLEEGQYITLDEMDSRLDDLERNLRECIEDSTPDMSRYLDREEMEELVESEAHCWMSTYWSDLRRDIAERVGDAIIAAQI